MNLPGRPTLYRLQAPYELSILNVNTYRFYARTLEHLIEYFGRDKEPQDISRAMAVEYRKHIESKGWKKTTVQSHMGVARSFFNWMKYMGVEGVLFNPFEDFIPKSSVFLK